MEITEVRIKLVSANNDKLRAFCSITIDSDFVVRDLKVIEGAKGPFVAMPSRKLTQRCARCGSKNPHRANYCNDCGNRFAPQRGGGDPNQRSKLHADIAHPINSRCREVIQREVLDKYAMELESSKAPDYRPPDLDDFEDEEPYLGSESSEGAFPERRRRFEPSEGFAARESGAARGGDVERRPSRLPRSTRGEGRDDRPLPQRGGWQREAPREGGYSHTGRVGSRGRDRSEDAGLGEGLGNRMRGIASDRDDFEESSEDFRKDEPARRSTTGAEPGRDRSLADERSSRFGGSREGSPASESSEKAPSGPSDVPSADDLGLLPRDTFGRKRRRVEEVEAEPEDNFGAGIFS